VQLQENLSDSIQQLKICILIPTYNNAKTLRRVIQGVLEYTSHIIVVNDGSTDHTSSVLADYPSLEVITLPKNRGKGYALRQGFKKAYLTGYDNVITIDSDGQHYPSDLPVFVNTLKATEEPVLLIGSRNLKQNGVPVKSNFGNKFSNFWFWFETGIKLQDTQSGYRLYPLKCMPKKYFTTKFEFEIEVIVRSAWKGIPVKNIPISVLYDPDERVSHFRPFTDFTRISILNTILVLITLIYIKPRDFVKKLKKKSFKQFIKEDILQSNDTKEVKALSIALGTFIGIAPLWGLQTFLAIFLPSIFRLNKVLSFVFSNISIPPMIPIIIYLSLKTGSLFIASEKGLAFDLDTITLESVADHIAQYLVGSIVLASVTALIFGVMSYCLLTLYSKKSLKDG